MNNKAINFIRNFSYTLTSNLISLLVSILVVLVVPKLIGIEDYGYWQLYMFYIAFVGFLHFGWNDGVYLRYGGKRYDELDKNLFFSQFYMLVIAQFIIAGLIGISTFVFIQGNDRIFIFQMIALGLVIVNVRLMLLFILQSTNRIKEYAQITLVDRILYSLLISIFLMIGIRDYKILIVADIIAKLISLCFAIYCCKDIVFQKFSKFRFSINEAILNINVGIKLMFANIASMLIIGVIRFGMERSWDVSTFGKVSLTLSIANLMMIFINAIGIVLFPVLRRIDGEKLSSIYVTIKNLLMLILFGILLLYYPLKVFLADWLPNYADSLIYMALLFPMCVYEGKMALLINTYLKTLREEKLLLKINLVSLILSIKFTILTAFLLKNLDLTVLSIVILLAFRCILAEILLAKLLGVTVLKDLFLETVMVIIFITVAWYVNSWLVVLLYFTAYLIYIIVKGRDIVLTTQNIKVLLKA